MEEKNNLEKNEAKEAAQELDLNALENVTGGGMSNVYVKKTKDVSESMKDRI